MNSVIEAQEEYFDRQQLWFAPGLPVTFYTKSFVFGDCMSIRPDHARMKREQDDFNQRNEYYQNDQKARLWDEKLNSTRK